jgi:tyrosine-protein phosphatase SIW14
MLKHLISTLCLVSFIGCTSTKEMFQPREEMVIKNTAASIKNFQVVEKDLYRGGRITASNVRFLSEDYKVKTIISLETYWNATEVRRNEVEAAQELGIKFIHIPMQPMGDVHAELVWKAVDMLAKEQKPIYLHCYRGSERTGLVVAGYRMKYEGWSYKQATEEMDRYGFSPLFKEWKEILLKVK